MQHMETWLVILFLSRKKCHAKQMLVLSSSMKLGPGGVASARLKSLRLPYSEVKSLLHQPHNQREVSGCCVNGQQPMTIDGSTAFKLVHAFPLCFASMWRLDVSFVLSVVTVLKIFPSTLYTKSLVERRGLYFPMEDFNFPFFCFVLGLHKVVKMKYTTALGSFLLYESMGNSHCDSGPVYAAKYPAHNRPCPGSSVLGLMRQSIVILFIMHKYNRIQGLN